MAPRNEALEVAIAECQKNNVRYRHELTKKHIMFYIGTNKLVLISKGCNDVKWVKNVRSNVRKAISELSVT